MWRATLISPSTSLRGHNQLWTYENMKWNILTKKKKTNRPTDSSYGIQEDREKLDNLLEIQNEMRTMHAVDVKF